MCGRYRLGRGRDAFLKYFGVDDEIDWSARYNIAPTQDAPVILQDSIQPVRHAALMRFGLIPSWSKDASGSARMINARAESAAEKPAFRDPLKLRRCIVPADGFYEWRQNGKVRQPYCFEVGNSQIFGFAGLWDRWRAPDGKNIESFTILTTQPNALLSGIHDRMPAILNPDDYDMWLDPGMKDVQAALEVIHPFDARQMRSFPVSTRVNSPDNDDEACAKPVEAEKENLSLF